MTTQAPSPDGIEPRLFLSRQQWEELPRLLDDAYFAQLAADNREALRLLDDHDGNILHVPQMLGEAVKEAPYENWRVLKKRLVRAAVGWYLDRDEACLRMARESIDYLTTTPNLWRSAWPQAGSQHADLKVGDLLYCATFAFDVFGPYLDAERVAALYHCLHDVGLDLYLKGRAAGEWWYHADFNWNSAVNGQAGLAALAIQPYDPALAAEVLAYVRAGLEYVIEALPPGGGWTEGLMYQGTMLGHLTDFVAALHRVTGDDLGLSTNRDLHDLIDTRPLFVAPDGRIVNFSNCMEDTVEYPLAQCFWWAQHCGRPEWAGFAEEHTKNWRDTHGLFHDVEALWFRQPHQPATPPTIPAIHHCSGLDWFFWRGKETFFAFRSGFNGGNHNNRDLGQIIFGAGQDRFLCDPGYGAGHTNQHNTVTVRGKEQADAAHARIFRQRRIPGGFYLACDLTSTYPNVLAYYTRHVLLIDETHLLILDDLLTTQGRRNSARWHLQTRCPWQERGDALVLAGRQHELLVRTLTGKARFAHEDWAQRQAALTTLTWTEPWDKVHSVAATLLSLKDEPASYTRDNDTFTLNVGTRTLAIDLAEGALDTVGLPGGARG